MQPASLAYASNIICEAEFSLASIFCLFQALNLCYFPEFKKRPTQNATHYICMVLLCCMRKVNISYTLLGCSQTGMIMEGNSYPDAAAAAALTTLSVHTLLCSVSLITPSYFTPVFLVFVSLHCFPTSPCHLTLYVFVFVGLPFLSLSIKPLSQFWAFHFLKYTVCKAAVKKQGGNMPGSV